MNGRTIAAAALAVAAAVAQGDAGQVRKIEDAVRVLEEMMKESDKSIPTSLIRDCAGIAVIPDVIRAGLVVGGRHGKGVLAVRTSSGGWSDPSFIDIKGGSVGWQAGVQSADIVLVFRTPRSLEKIVEGDFTVGADIGVAAGPLGRAAEASTDSALKAEILSYSRSRGLYAGLTLQGSSIREDRKANRAFYGSDIAPKDILAGKAAGAPEAVSKLKAALAEAEKK
ncbi:MAG TPA: lipid-binding SYLF domain-containing protein [Candidatus Aminicenantes bacterium]|nr:lipid-binding SYLF domain-containing protein [Candidatus Aminicenantes bacterium]